MDNQEETLSTTIIAILEELEDLEPDTEYLTQDQVADMLGNDQYHHVQDGDDLFYLAYPDQREENY